MTTRETQEFKARLAATNQPIHRRRTLTVESSKRVPAAISTIVEKMAADRQTPTAPIQEEIDVNSNTRPNNTEIESECSQLTDSRQSKLSSEQLGELQRSTHFDKKELQSWYKGKPIISDFMTRV